MGLFGGRRDSLFVNPFKQVTKAPCKFHLLQEACSSPVVCSAPLFLPCSLQDYRLRCLCPGRNAAWPQRAAASCFAQPHVGFGHDALQIRDLTELRRLVGACLKPALPKQNADSAKVPGSAEHHDAPIPSERVCKSSCGASCCTASGTHTPSSLTSGDIMRRQYFELSGATSVRAFNGRVGKGALCAPCPPLATDRVGTARAVKLASRNNSARAPLPTLQR